MKKITLMTLLCLGLSSCDDENVYVDKKLLIKEIIGSTDNSKLVFVYNPDSTLSSIVNTNTISIKTWNFKYEGSILTKMSRVIENVGSINLVVESNDSIFLNFGSNNKIASIYIRSVDSDELVERIEYRYAADNSIKEIEYINFLVDFSETSELTFKDDNVVSVDNISYQYDSRKNPVNEMGLAYKDFYWGDFEFGTYFSKNNVIKSGSYEYVFSYNEFKYPTKMKTMNDKNVVNEWTFTYY